MSDTAATIQARLLSNIDSTYDTSDGSFFYDAEDAVAIELATSYATMDTILNNGFPDTATGTYLDQIVSEQGITRKQAGYGITNVTVTGSVGTSVPLGGIVGTDTINYAFTQSAVIPDTGSVSVPVQCVVAGSIGNVPFGAIQYFPVTIQGLTSVTNPTQITSGYDTETDDELRQRYYAQVQSPATSGNISHYQLWCSQCAGVGACQIYPLWNGAGTVKVCALDVNSLPLSSTVLANLQSYIESQRPIGATVTYTTGVELPINISVIITLSNGYTDAQVQSAIATSITSYLASIAFNQNTVSYAKIGSLILSTSGVADYSNLTVNGDVLNVTIPQEQVATIGSVTVG
jgi:uncharacterized phage protein gp47/JayE